VSRGSLIVFHGLFPHLSLANRSTQSRHAYTLHAVSAGTTYATDNWIQRTLPKDAPFAGFTDLESGTCQ
jgi:phytanoyl-CoA hydroxylase